MDFQLTNNAAALASKMRLFPSGGLSVNSTTDPGAGVVNANTGFKLGNAEFPTASNGLVNRTGANTYAAKTAPSGAVVGDTDTQTLSNKSITQRVVSQASGATWSPNADTTDVFTITTAQATNVTTISAPSGTPVDGQSLIFRIKCDATPRTLAGWDAIYRFSSDMAAPSTLVASKTYYLGFKYNSTDSKWDNVAQLNNF